MKNKIIEILMRRDGLTEQEAKELFLETREMIYECNGDIIEAEDIMASQLGLELDYIFDLL